MAAPSKNFISRKSTPSAKSSTRTSTKPSAWQTNQALDVTANAAKIHNIEALWLDDASNTNVTLVGTDIANITSSNALYVVGGSDDQVSAGNGYTLLATNQINNAIAPGHFFNEYQHSSGSLLFVDNLVTLSITAAQNQAPNILLAGLGGAQSGANFSAAYTTGVAAGVAIADTDAVVDDPDGADTPGISAHIADLTATLTDPHSGASEFLHLTAAGQTLAASNGLSVGGQDSTSLTITGLATDTVYQSLLQDIVYINTDTSVGVNTADRHVNVTTHDGVGAISNTPTATIALTRGNHAPTITSDGGGDNATLSIAENTTAVTTVHATDVDAGTVLQYTKIGGADAAKFDLDLNSGVLSFHNAPDFETPTGSVNGGEGYVVQVQASDGIATDVQTITVNVTNANLAPVITSGATGSEAENTPIANAVYTVTATDDGENSGTLVYSLSSGGDNDLFAINGSTGAVTFKNSPNFESPLDSGGDNHYDITVHANDGTLDTTKAVQITVTDVNDVAPVFTSSATPSVPENTTDVVDLTTTDPDTVGANPPTFTITGGADQAKFTITGGNHLAFVSAPDFENPTDSGANNVYDVQVTANDGANPSVQNIAVTVTNQNDPPVLSVNGADAGTSLPVTIDEDTPYDFAANSNQLSFADPDALGTDFGELDILFNTNGTISGPGNLLPSGGGAVGISLSNIKTYLEGLVFTPESNYSGPVTMTITVHDLGHNGTGGDKTDSLTVNFTVNLVNDAPVLTGSNTLSYTENDPASAINPTLTVGDVDNTTLAAATVTISGNFQSGEDVLAFVNNNAATFGNIQVDSYSGGVLSLSSPGATATLAQWQSALQAVTYADTSDNPDTGTRIIDFVANDGSASSLAASSNVNVTATNDAPVAAVPTAQTVDEDTDLVFSTGTGNAITVSDADLNAGILSVTLQVTSGKLTLGSLAGLNTSSGDGTSSVAISGTQAAIDNALDGLKYRGNLDFNGSDTLQILLDDNGNTPAPHQTGTASIGITINPINDAPAGTDNTVTALEDGSHTFAASEFGFADPVDAASAGGANALQAVIITTLPVAATGTLTLDTGGGPVAVTPGQSIAVGDIGGLVFTPAANANGSAEASFTFQVVDNGGNANGGVDTDQSANTMTIDVTPVNDAPAGQDHTINPALDTTLQQNSTYTFLTGDFGFSDPVDAASASGANNFAGVVITAAPAAATGTLKDNGVTVSDGDFVSAAHIAGGLLQFTPATDHTGAGESSFTFQVRDDGGGLNGGIDTDQSANTMTINVTPNTPPTATDDSISATEKGGLNDNVPCVDPSGNIITDADPVADSDNEDANTALRVAAFGTHGVGNPDNGTVGGPAVAGQYGALTIDQFGAYHYTVDNNNTTVKGLHTSADILTDVFHYTVVDTGGLTDDATITFTIHGANDLPEAHADTGTMNEDDTTKFFDVIGNDTQDTDSTALNAIGITGTVTASSGGDPNIDNGDVNALAVAGNQIEVTLGSDFQGLTGSETATITVPYTLTGDTSPLDTSSSTLTITVQGVNDVPVAHDDTGSMTEDQSGTAFTVKGNDTLDVDHTAPNNVTYYAGTHPLTIFSAPSGEGIDATDVSVSVNGSNQIVVTFVGTDFQNMKDGEVTHIHIPYTLHGDQPGDTSLATLDVTVNGANDAPHAANFTFDAASSAIGNTALVLDNGSGASPTDPAGPQKTISGSLLTGATDVDGPNTLVTVAGTFATSQGGSVIINADGDFTYLPKAGFIGTDTFTYQVSDQNPGTPGIGTGTVSINVANPVWYVDNTAAAGGDGTSDNPFNTLVEAQNASAANDTIFVYHGDGTTTGQNAGITLKDGQHLIGEGVGLTVAGTNLVTAGSQAHIGNSAGDGVSMTNVVPAEIQGLAISGSNNAIDNTINTAVGGTLVIANNTIVSAGAEGIDINKDGSATLTLDVHDNTWSASTGNAFDVTKGASANPGFVRLNFHDNTVVSSAEGVHLDSGSSSSGQITVTGFANNTVSGNTGGTGIDVTGTAASPIVFDSNVGTGAYEAVSGGTTTIGASGNGVGGSGLVLNHVAGNLSFNDLESYADNGTGLKIVGTGSASPGTGSGTLVTTTTGNVVAVNGPAVDLTNATGQLNFSNVSSTNSTGTGVNFTGFNDGSVAASFSATSGSIQNATSTDFNIASNNADISYGGSITDSTGQLVSESGSTGGTKTFSGAISDSGSGTGSGISLTSNSSTTTNFTGGVSLSTGANNAFVANSGGIVNVTGTNHITTTTGTALNVTNTTIGASGLNFHDISANGAAHAIILNNTGTTGHLAVTGSGNTGLGGDNSGGTIQNTTDDAISLTNTKGPSFTNINIQGSAASGIQGTGVTDFTLANSTINNVNTAHTGTVPTGIDGNVAFNADAGGANENNLSGVVSITGNTLNNSWQNGISISNYAGTISSLTITGNSLTSNPTFQAGSAGTAIQVLAQNAPGNAAQINAGTISNNTINNFPGDGGIVVHGGSTAANMAVHIGASGAANHFIIDSNTITGNGPGTLGLGTNGVEVTIGEASSGYFTIGENGKGNTITNVKGNGIAASLFGTGTLSADIGYNTVNANNTVNSPGINTGADSSATGNTGHPTLYLNIHNNHVSNTTGNGILSTIRSVDGTGYFKIENNTVDQPIQGTTAYGIRVDSGNGSESAGATVNLQIDGNTTTGGKNGSGTLQAPGIGLRQNHSGPTGTFNIVGLSPDPSNDTQMDTYVSAHNTSTPGTGFTEVNGVASISTGGTFHSIASLPAFPLLAASGGVDSAAPTPGETHLTDAELSSVIPVALAYWLAAGISADQLALLDGTGFTVAELSDGTLAQTSENVVTFDASAAGHGWFVDPTPQDNAEFANVANAAGTDLFTDPSTAAAGHMDLLTTVMHEMGHVLGLPDTSNDATGNLMDPSLVEGERRLPDASNVAQTEAAESASGTPSAGGETFAFDKATLAAATGPAPTIEHVAAPQGDTFDFSALLANPMIMSVTDDVVRVDEDASGAFATLQVNTAYLGSNMGGGTMAAHWVAVAELDGLHPGDAVNVSVNGLTSVHVAQIQAGWSLHA